MAAGWYELGQQPLLPDIRCRRIGRQRFSHYNRLLVLQSLYVLYKVRNRVNTYNHDLVVFLASSTMPSEIRYASAMGIGERGLTTQ